MGDFFIFILDGGDKPEIKIFRTPNGKELRFTPEEIVITCEDDTIFIRLHNPVQIGERQSSLGLNACTYRPDINAIRQSANLYVYCMNNPLIYVDPSGNAATFYKDRSGDWTFVKDDKFTNVLVSSFGFVPFLDNGIWWATDTFSGSKSITTHMMQDIVTTFGASLGLASNAIDALGGVSKFATVAGHISTILTAGNIVYEMCSDKSYVNQITAKIFDGYYNARSFDYTAKYFIAYTALTKDMIDRGIITYQVKHGKAVWINYDQATFDKYFSDMGITVSDVAKMVRGW